MRRQVSDGEGRSDDRFEELLVDDGPSLREIARVFASIGILSFGGAAGQIAMMYRVIVEERRWLDEERFMHALNYCMLLPGPEAQQLATYIGWLKGGIRGGLIAGLLFVVPGAAIMLALSFLYVFAANVAVVEGIFFGIKAAVLALIAQAVVKIAARGLKTRLLLALAVLAFVGLYVFNVAFPLILVATAALGLVLGAYAPAAIGLPAYPDVDLPPPPTDRWKHTVGVTLIGLSAWWLPVLFAWLVLGGSDIVVQLGLFFSKLAVLTFGGAYALLVWLAQEAVARGWVDTLEMADGLGLAETTPGPTILVTQFVGFLAAYRDASSLSPVAAAVAGALMTTWVTFAPSFLWIFAGAPYVEDLRGNTGIAAALRAVSAAVVGVVAYLGVWLGLNVVFRDIMTFEGDFWRLVIPDPTSIDGAAALLAAIAFGLVFVARLGLLPVVGIMAALGVAARYLA